MHVIPNYNYQIPDEIRQELLDEGATEVTAELFIYDDGSTVEYEVVAKGTFPDNFFKNVPICAKPCFSINL